MISKAIGTTEVDENFKSILNTRSEEEQDQDKDHVQTSSGEDEEAVALNLASSAAKFEH